MINGVACLVATGRKGDCGGGHVGGGFKLGGSVRSEGIEQYVIQAFGEFEFSSRGIQESLPGLSFLFEAVDNVKVRDGVGQAVA